MRAAGGWRAPAHPGAATLDVDTRLSNGEPIPLCDTGTDGKGSRRSSLRRPPIVPRRAEDRFVLALCLACLALVVSSAASPQGGDHSAGYEEAFRLLKTQTERAQGARMMRELAEGGDRDAQYFLGQVFYDPAWGQQNYREAFQWFQKAAEQGHVEAQHFIGIMYSRGSHVAADQEMAVRWYRKAAEGGSPSAMFDLAYRYETGRGVERDLKLAARWYERAVASGFEAAAGNLRNLKILGEASGEPEFFSRLQDAAAGGDVEAQWKLFKIFSEGGLLAEGRPPIRKDPEKAAHWLTEAASKRHPEAVRIVIRSGFFQGCRLGCFLHGVGERSCSSDCSCLIEALEDRFTPLQLADEIYKATNEGDEDALVGLVDAMRVCGGIRV